MPRDLKYDAEPVKLPHVSALGFDRWIARPGDIILYEWAGGEQLARVIGRITWTDNDGPDGTGRLLVACLSENMAFAYERWVEPKDVRRCFGAGPSAVFLQWFMSAGVGDLESYVRHPDGATRYEVDVRVMEAALTS